MPKSKDKPVVDLAMNGTTPKDIGRGFKYIHVKPWINSHYSPDDNNVFQQDGAPPHADVRKPRGHSRRICQNTGKKSYGPLISRFVTS